jgi:hypothetical protein
VEEVRVVIVHEAPTFWNQVPRFENVFAIHSHRKSGCRKGRQVEKVEAGRGAVAEDEAGEAIGPESIAARDGGPPVAGILESRVGEGASPPWAGVGWRRGEIERGVA